MKKKKGFTLIELLAVIVILAIILVIAVPKILNVIDDARDASFISSGNLTLSIAEKNKMENATLGIENKEITDCSKYVNLSEDDYEKCVITYNEELPRITLIGKGKFANRYVCNKNKNELIIEKSCESIPVELTVELNGGSTTQKFNNIYNSGDVINI